MVSKTGKIAIAALVVVIIVVAIVMVEGFVVTQPHFGFANKNQVDSETGQGFKTTNTSKMNVSNGILFNLTGVSGAMSMTYSNGTNGSCVWIVELQFSSSYKATQSYTTVLSHYNIHMGLEVKVAVNSTYGSFQYSEIGILISHGAGFIFAHSGTFLVLLDFYGISQSGATAVFHSTVSRMTSLSL